jgi:integrase
VARYGADAARPTGVRAIPAEPGAATTGVEDAPSSASAKARARRQAEALAELIVAEAKARLVLDWTQPLRHATFYKAIYRPAVLRANREAGATVLPPELKFHSLRHSYASLCVAAGIRPDKLSGRMGHANVRTTLDVHVHLFPDDDATEDMAALGALATVPKPAYSGNVVPLHG